MKFTAIAVVTAIMITPAFAGGHATGDAAAGEKVYKKCKSCHMIVADDGTEIVKGGKTGPNLYGILGRTAGDVDGYRYGKSIIQAGENGLAWDEAEFVAWMADPRKYLQAYLDDSSAKAKMSFKLRDAEDAANLWAYLVSVGPAEEMKEEATN